MTADELAALLTGDGELALLDVRDGTALWREGTPLLAVHLPLAELAERAPALVPRRATQVVVLDGDGGALADAAAAKLRGLGYTAVAALAGGAAGWAASGRELYRSENVLARAFGAFVAEQRATPAIAADELAELLEGGADVVVLDSRPAVELADHAIPGARSAPGAELLARGVELIASPRTTVVVTCAARTRGILGAQALIDAGLPNPVRMLAGGTMGWWSAQQPLLAGAEPQAPPRSQARAADRAAAVATLRERFGLAVPLSLREWERTAPSADGTAPPRLAAPEGTPSPAGRTTYLLDVRDPAEHRAAHLPGSRPAPSWELVPKAFSFVAVLRATIVLVDDAPGLRGLLTASWLRRMGWRDVRVVALEPAQLAQLPPSSAVPPPAREPGYAPWRDPERAAAFDAYLGWEQGLLAQLARDETTPFAAL